MSDSNKYDDFLHLIIDLFNDEHEYQREINPELRRQEEIDPYYSYSLRCRRKRQYKSLKREMEKCIKTTGDTKSDNHDDVPTDSTAKKLVREKSFCGEKCTFPFAEFRDVDINDLPRVSGKRYK